MRGEYTKTKTDRIVFLTDEVANQLKSWLDTDIEISHADHITYLEMKTSAVKEKSRFRYFYYTNVDKIKANARHLLLDVSVTQDTPRYWKIDECELNDLSILNLCLKNEFNASKRDLMDINTRI